MKPSLAGASWLLLASSVLLLVALTAFESALMGMSLVTERIVSFLLLVLPAATGAGLGLLSLVRKEGRPGLALTGVLLNSAFAIFHLTVTLFAG